VCNIFNGQKINFLLLSLLLLFVVFFFQHWHDSPDRALASSILRQLTPPSLASVLTTSYSAITRKCLLRSFHLSRGLSTRLPPWGFPSSTFIQYHIFHSHYMTNTFSTRTIWPIRWNLLNLTHFNVHWTIHRAINLLSFNPVIFRDWSTAETSTAFEAT
jgi:hypothetical protein